MQSLALSHSHFTTNHFVGQIRFNRDKRLLNLNRSTNARGRSSRAPPPPCFMSGPPAAEGPLQTFQQTRFQDCLEFPHVVTTTNGASESVVAPASPTIARESTPQDVSSFQHLEISSPQRRFTISEPLSSSQLAPVLARHRVSQSVESAYSPSTLSSTSPSGPPSRTLPQKPTRRTKAHVASACVNCKKKHLGCDSARPCRRCVLAGKASTCVDVTHKKRGRPPLKAEEASLRPYTAQFDNPVTPAELQQRSTTTPTTPQPTRTHGHKPTPSREIRPVTDLQVSHGGTGNLQRWSFSVPPSQPRGDTSPSLTIGSLGRRPFSSGSSHQHMAPGAFPAAGGFNPPTLEPSHQLSTAAAAAAGTGRPLSSYAHQAPLLPAVSQPQYQQPFVGERIAPFLDRSTAPAPAPVLAPMSANWLPISERPLPLSRDRCESYPESPVRLPPILPSIATTGPDSSPSHHVPRFNDPYQAPTWSWSLRSRENFSREGQGQDQPRPSSQPGPVEPVSPRTQLHHQSPYESTHGHGDLQARHGGAIPSLTMPTSYQGQPLSMAASIGLDTGTTSGEQSKAGTEGRDSRPIKRRRMSLNDMVND